MRDLTLNEIKTINGGHDGTAYEAGKMLGQAVTKAAVLIGLAVLILSPKS